jgi:hypothetical protein
MLALRRSTLFSCVSDYNLSRLLSIGRRHAGSQKKRRQIRSWQTRPAIYPKRARTIHRTIVSSPTNPQCLYSHLVGFCISFSASLDTLLSPSEVILESLEYNRLILPPCQARPISPMLRVFSGSRMNSFHGYRRNLMCGSIPRFRSEI